MKAKGFYGSARVLQGVGKRSLHRARFGAVVESAHLGACAGPRAETEAAL